jgi:citrate synthase
MNSPKPSEKVRTRIWFEEPEPDNAFATRAAHCHGYDVYGDMLGHAGWAQMVYLLFRGEAPSSAQAALLDGLAVALANAGPRDPAVHAAMCAGVGGSTAAASLMAALAVGAGQHTGARDVYLAMQLWVDCGTQLDAWAQRLTDPVSHDAGIWPEADHPPGFDPHGERASTLVLEALSGLARLSEGRSLRWLHANRGSLETLAAQPLSLSGVAAAAFIDLGFTPDQGEMLHLLLRLPGAAAHALEQRALGHKNFPFFALDLQNDPAKSLTRNDRELT